MKINEKEAEDGSAVANKLLDETFAQCTFLGNGVIV